MTNLKRTFTIFAVTLLTITGLHAGASSAHAQNVRIYNGDEGGYSYVSSGNSSVYISNGRRSNKYKNKSYNKVRKSRNSEGRNYNSRRRDRSRYDDADDYSYGRSRNSYARRGNSRMRNQRVRVKRVKKTVKRYRQGRAFDRSERYARVARNNRGSSAEAYARAVAY